MGAPSDDVGLLLRAVSITDRDNGEMRILLVQVAICAYFFDQIHSYISLGRST